MSEKQKQSKNKQRNKNPLCQQVASDLKVALLLISVQGTKHPNP